ncbi:Glu/Leu/Phe/Val dehydrogenase dimerization domain-containing protein [Streptomyces sp. DSM 44915]|uniref:Valine dehydrogenase n=1 Tax=Streptomyces chisholmiae TaxID=3075540 RepID=A0ABU2JZ95_9ACTN|nr:Glu/Leu/Phe/Val dehydrogenase dimerization domain-containing protein [Streptomyces sp. DSM 44915]MDT0270081.1 Glu/Leu/Phe/Val dehydrogenase dimerization domain-containing protein [Streptomyces sp. DSM 44915]
MTDVRPAVTTDSNPAAEVLDALFHSDQGGHEQVVLCQDRPTGLRAVIAVHSTALGPALGGTRFHAYQEADHPESAALADALRLARGMTYKNALAGLPHGGGKAVIIGDPEKIKTEELLLAYGRCVAALGGRYVTACDVGTYVQDMDVIARSNRWTTGRSPEQGGAGDSSVLTSYGVFQAMLASAEHRWGSPELTGRTVGVAGVGKVGHLLVDQLVEAGARVLVNDVNPAAVARVRAAHPEVTAVPSVDELVADPALDIYAPCALGGVLNDRTVPLLRAAIVCGAANNQLDHPGVEKDLADRGVLYAPDYVVNSGGVIQVADELSGFNFARAKEKAAEIRLTTREIFQRADADGVPPAVAADRIAEQRIAQARGVDRPFA